MIFINFKNYLHGNKALELAKKVEKYLPKAIVAVSAVDIKEIAEKTKLKVYAQHVDCSDSVRATGFVLPKAIKEVGAKGSLLNHSEHKLPFDIIKKALEIMKKEKVDSLLCVSSLDEARKLKELNPEMMAYEDSELVGTGKSISKFRQEEVKKFVEILKGKKIIPLCGAGVNTVEDVKAAFKLGCKGVLIASAIANVDLNKAEKLLKELSKLKFNFLEKSRSYQSSIIA